MSLEPQSQQPLTRNQQIVQQALTALGVLEVDSEPANEILRWFEALSLSPIREDMLFGHTYRLSRDDMIACAALTIPQPSWFGEPEFPLQYAVPGMLVAFLTSTDLYAIAFIDVVVTRKGCRGEACTLLRIEKGVAEGWYNLSGTRVTREGKTYQGSAYAGRIEPITEDIHETMRTHVLLTEITGYHKATQGSGSIFSADTECLLKIRDLLWQYQPPAPEPLSVNEFRELLEGHGILTVDTARRLCAFVGEPFPDRLVMTWQSRREAQQKYGFLATSEGPGQGVDSLDLSYYFCTQLEIEAPGCNYTGVGSQARENARAILQELSLRGRV